MRYIVCPANNVQLFDPISGVPADAPQPWAVFIRGLFCEQSVMQSGVNVLDLIELRLGLAALKQGECFPVTDEHWGILSAACSAPRGFPPAWVYSGGPFFAAIIRAPTTKPASLVAKES